MSKPSRTPNPRPPSGTSKPAAALPPPTASEAAFERLLAHFDDPGGDPAALTASATVPPADDIAPEVDAMPEAGATPEAGAARFVSDLFARGREFLVRDRFATIGEAGEFFTKIVGVSFEGRQNIVAGLQAGQALTLARDPGNVHDSNAVAVRFGTLHLGYLRREIAAKIAPKIDAGDSYSAVVGSVTGGGARHVGVNIHVRRRRATAALDALRGEAAREAGATDSVRVALIGERPLRDAQRAVLARVDTGRNTLAVLGTGRGKSLCFQLPAAERALARGDKTLVFYPLRALANDQFEALTRRLAHFGLRILRANGAIDGEERSALDDALDTGAWDVILSTPEFATYHREAFSRACNRPALVVVDEAHHVFESRHRPAYGTLGALVRELGAAQVLALTATAGEEAFHEIRRSLGIDAWVIDPTVRENLHVVDARNTTDKNAYLARELGRDGKAIVYCNSRSEATKLAERLRARFGDTVAFYHAGIPSPDRAEVERLFRGGAVQTIVATSAFGEGIDLPDVRDVVLYHLNFDLTEFNQMSGRAGRDGLDSRIHLLYGDKDRSLNDFIIAKSAPSLEVLRELYRGMRGLASEDVLRMNYEDIARTLQLDKAEGATVGIAVRIFEEGGLVSTGLDDDGRFVRFREVSGKVDLTKTTRYAENQAERDAFERFCRLALEADAKTLETVINRPIYPDRVPLEH
jgi:single-stranded-DNA-specific exonuclease